MRVNIGELRLFVDIDGFALAPEGRYLQERPVIILVHGGPGYDHGMQKTFAPLLSEFAQVICYDQRGHGRSDRAGPQSWNLAHWADDIVRLCDVLGIEKPIVLGSSFGGIVAQAYAIRHPQHPGKMILHSTTPHFALDRILRKFEELGGEEARRIAEALWQDPGDPERLGPYTKVCMPLYNVKRRNPDDTKDWMITNPDVLTHFYSLGAEGHQFDFRPELQRIECPTLVISGTEDPICPIDDARDIAANLRPDICTFIPFENCGHGLNWDDPTRFQSTVREFVLG